MSDVLTNLTRPKTAATITLRIIKSFEYRIEKNLVLHDLDLERTTAGALKEKGRQAINTQPGWKPFRSVVLDTLKLYTQAHGAKTSNLIINLDHEELILDNNDAYLVDLGFGTVPRSAALLWLEHHVENETEVSFFNREAYEKFKANPEIKWM